MKNAVLITGASSGIGEAFAYKYAELGENLILTARSKEKLEKLKNKLMEKFAIEVLIIVLDLSKENAAKEIYDKLEKEGIAVSALVNNAGYATSGEFISNSFVSQHEQVMLNVTSLVDLSYYFLDNMKKNKKGVIINIASTGAFQPLPYMSVYGATKAFVLSFSEGLYEEYKNYGIKVIAVCPGPTETNFFESAGPVSVGKFRTPKMVVDSTFKALGRNKNHVVDGVENRLVSLSSRFLTRKRMAKIIGNMLRKKLDK